MVYRRVLVGDVVSNNPEQLINFTDEVSNVDLLFLLDESLM